MKLTFQLIFYVDGLGMWSSVVNFLIARSQLSPSKPPLYQQYGKSL